MIARDWREKRDWSEVSTLRVAPVAHGVLVSLTTREQRGDACLNG